MERQSLITSLFAALTAIVSFSLQAQVPMGSLKGTLTTQYQDMVYSLDTKSKSYVLTSAATRITGQLMATGTLKAALKADSVPVDDTVQGIVGKRKIIGFSSVQLQNANGALVLISEFQLADSVSGFPLATSGKFTLPVQLVQGSWEDFQAGKTVDLELSPGSEDIYNQAMTKALSTLLTNAFAKGFQGFQVKSSVDSVQLTQPVKIKASLRQVIISPLVTRYALTLILNM